MQPAASICLLSKAYKDSVLLRYKAKSVMFVTFSQNTVILPIDKTVKLFSSFVFLIFVEPLTHMGAFNSYVEQILHNYDHLTPSNGQLWTFYIITNDRSLCLDFLLTSYPLLSCPHSYWMPLSLLHVDFYISTIWWIFIVQVTYLSNSPVKTNECSNFHRWETSCQYPNELTF